MCGSLLCFVCLDKSLEHVGSADANYAAATICPLQLSLSASLEVLTEAILPTCTQVEACIACVGSD